MPSKRNLLIYLEQKEIKKADFYLKTGLSNGFLDKNDNISSNNIEIIISTYLDLNVEWLITGQGSMLKNDTKKIDLKEKNKEAVASVTQDPSPIPMEAVNKNLIDKVVELSAENALLKKENEEIKKRINRYRQPAYESIEEDQKEKLM
jgi:hypothetical protein